ncbi:MAG: Anaerobic glycerol-3-phosphate dehydrogenase subunit C [Candidatus Heimdallarchaeota archaeon LC_3]|nr:MAG: Anaerobic glycerol-3-phosphate dehydrogenase subunit C [Candidatus Heimdallarchaeota archaeon LC_3]
MSYGMDLGKENRNQNAMGDPKFFNKESLEEEMRRQFQACSDCRMCLHYCPFFPVLFDIIDQELDGETKKINSGHIEKLNSLCYHCKLCEFRCPYIPPHELELDVPRLFLRYQAVKGKEKGVSIRTKLQVNTDLIGSMASKTAPISNWGLMKHPLNPNRLMLHYMIGIHKKSIIPQYKRETAKKYAKKKLKSSVAKGDGGKIALFTTCLVNNQRTDIAKATLAVLEKHDVIITVPPQMCCGMPELGVGWTDKFQANMIYNIKSFKDLVDNGYDVVTLQPTCGNVLLSEYPKLAPNDLIEPANNIADHTFDIMNFLWKLKLDNKLSREFNEEGFGTITYHVSCHTQAQRKGLSSRMLNLLPNTKVKAVTGCTGVDGTWGLRTANRDMSVSVAKDQVLDKIAEMDPQPDWIVSDCPLAGSRIEEELKIKVLTPIEMMAKAYGLIY